MNDKEIASYLHKRGYSDKYIADKIGWKEIEVKAHTNKKFGEKYLKYLRGKIKFRDLYKAW